MKAKDYLTLKAKFLKIYANIPDRLREEIIVVVNGEPYTWTTATFEIKNDSELGKNIIRILKELQIL